MGREGLTVKADAVLGTELLVLHDTPVRVRSLLDDDALARIRFVDVGALYQRPAGHRDLEQLDCQVVKGSILCLPIDGPRSAVQMAVEGLMRDATGSIVAPSSDGGSPPPWWSLELVSSSGTPAVDLRSAPWHDQRGVWWADRAGPMHVPVVIHGRNGHQQAAGILRALLERTGVQKIIRWLDDVAGGGRAPGPADWDTVLCANYLTHALSRVEQHRAAGTDA